MTGANAKIKRIYVGDKQVRPKWNYEYEYNFVGKSVSTCQNDGWTFNNISNVAFNSDGIYYNTSTTGTLLRSFNQLSNAKKVQYSINYKFGGDNGIGCTLCTLTDSSDSTQNGLVNNKNGNTAYASVGWYLQNGRTYKENLTAQYYKQTLTFDLVNKTILLNTNGNTYTGTLTDANVTSIRSNNGLRLYRGQRPSTTPQVYCQSIGIKVL